MKLHRLVYAITAMIAIVIIVTQASCKKKDSGTVPDYLTVDLPTFTLQNDLYYSVSEDSRFIELEFSQAIDSTTIRKNLSFCDKTSTFDTCYSILALDRMVVLMFHPSFQLKNGWRYNIRIGTGLKSVSGLAFESMYTVELRTPAFTLKNDVMQRNGILCISDIHMGEERAVVNNYCWFSKNDTALTHLLDLALNSHLVKQVVILGDLFDGWIIPYRFAPFDSSANVHDIRGYFTSVANAAVNVPVMAKLKAIAKSTDLQLIYVPGNHDMLLTKSVLEELIPGVIWSGNIPGMGNYIPVNEIVMEHGHRFDFFNCPQPLVKPDHMLPPGFFVSRLQAECSRTHPAALLKDAMATNNSFEFTVAWRLALDFLEIQYKMTVHEDSVNIRMDGIDGYDYMFSFNSAKAMYAANIEDNWTNTQIGNQVPVNIPVIMAILDGQDDLFTAVGLEYFSSLSPIRYKIAVLGHTHKPEIKVFPSGKNYTAIYANTGSWVNQDLTSNKVRTFVMIWPGAWTGSDLDIVSLYQYNLDSGNGNQTPGYIPVLLSEESISKGN